METILSQDFLPLTSGEAGDRGEEAVGGEGGRGGRGGRGSCCGEETPGWARRSGRRRGLADDPFVETQVT